MKNHTAALAVFILLVVSGPGCSDHSPVGPEPLDEQHEHDEPPATEPPATEPPITEPPAGMYPNQPAGYNVIASSDMSEYFSWGPGGITGGHGSWWQHTERDPDTSIRQSASAPGGPAVNRTRYPRGMGPGRGPVSWGGWTSGSFQTGAEHERIYFSQRLRLVDPGSGDWESQQVGTKLGFWGVGRCGGAANEIYPLLQGGTRSGFTIRMMQQNVSSRGMGQNRKSGPVMKVGEWHHWEVEMILNDVGKANGVLRWWIDGELIMEHTDVVYRTSGQSCGFRGYKWNPTWGGSGGGNKSRDDFIDISDIRISGKQL